MSHCLNAERGCVMWGFGGVKQCNCACEVCAAPRPPVTPPAERCPPEMAALVEMLRLSAGDAATARIMHMQCEPASPLTMRLHLAAESALLAAIAKLESRQAEADRTIGALVGAVEARLIAASITADEMDRAPCGVCGSFAPRFKKWIDDFGADVRAALPKDPTP